MINEENCIFCRIIRGEIPCDKVYEDSEVMAFLDINPVNEGHVLVIPKNHYKDMMNTPDELVGIIFSKSKALMKRIKKALNADFVVLAVVGVDVPHFHIHLVPRYFNDGLKNFWPTKKYSEGESVKFARKIRETKD